MTWTLLCAAQAAATGRESAGSIRFTAFVHEAGGEFVVLAGGDPQAMSPVANLRAEAGWNSRRVVLARHVAPPGALVELWYVGPTGATTVLAKARRPGPSVATPTDARQAQGPRSEMLNSWSLLASVVFDPGPRPDVFAPIFLVGEKPAPETPPPEPC